MKKLHSGTKIFAVIFFSVIILIIITSYHSFPDEKVEVNLGFDGERAFEHLQNQLNCGFRIPGTKGSELCLDYFRQQVKALDTENTFLNALVNEFMVKGINCRNLLIKLNERKSPIIILAAHYDSRAKATMESLDTPIEGANDGASGSAVLLELMQVLYEKKDLLNIQMWFLFLDAEDQGDDHHGEAMEGFKFCEGSQAFVNSLESYYDVNIEKIDQMLLLDMVGNANLTFIREKNSNQNILNTIFDTGAQLGFHEQFQFFPKSRAIIDDHVYFNDIGIPSAVLIDDFEQKPWYHTTLDTIDLIEITSLLATGRTVEQYIYDLYLD